MTPFYTSRAKAAYMAEEYGMAFMPDCWTHEALRTPHAVMEFAHAYFRGRFYVHPSSMFLLQQFSQERVIALKLLGLWPEFDNAAGMWYGSAATNREG